MPKLDQFLKQIEDINKRSKYSSFFNPVITHKQNFDYFTKYFSHLTSNSRCFILASLLYIFKTKHKHKNSKHHKLILSLLSFINRKNLRFLCLLDVTYLEFLKECANQQAILHRKIRLKKKKKNLISYCYKARYKTISGFTRIISYKRTFFHSRDISYKRVANYVRLACKIKKLNKFQLNLPVKDSNYFDNQKQTSSLLPLLFLQRKKSKNSKGILYIHLKKRNVICTLIDYQNKKVKANCSLGIANAKEEESNLTTDYDRVYNLMLVFLEKVKLFSYKKYIVIFAGRGTLKGINPSIGKALRAEKILVCNFLNNTLAAHNGCRLRKPRRKKIRTKLSYRTAKTVFGL